MQHIILDNLSTAVIMLDSELTVRHMNTAAESLLECSLPKTVNRPIDNVFHISGQWQKEILQTIDDRSSFTRRQITMDLVNTANQITVDYTVTPFTHEEMHQEGHDGVLIEIQALDRLLRISKEEALLSTEQTSRTLIRGVAHEIKNPLAGIRGAAQLLSRELKTDEQKDYTRVIIDEADRLRNLVDRMLGINRPLQMEELNVHEVLEHVAALAEVEVADKIAVERDYDPSLPPIRGDREQLIQVVLNIVRNAIQALQASGRESPQITLKTRAQHHFTIGQEQHRMVCRVDVVDNGGGIPADIAENIFYPMISGRAEGTGLGLAIAQSIVIQHKGLIECHSEPGKTVFSLYLPLVGRA